MTLTVTQAFEKCLEDITATKYQKETLIPAKKNSAIENLTATFPSTSDLPFSQAFLMGSAAKGTIVRPFDDVDVLAVFSNKKNAWDKYWNDSAAFLYRIRRAYDGVSVQQVGARGQAVRIFFVKGGHVDVAPVFRDTAGHYSLPSGTGGWINTAPLIANKWFADKNAEFSYNLAPVVRLLKKWNLAHSKRLQSFHLETIAANLFGTLGSGRQKALLVFFNAASSYIDVSDPGGQSGILSSYLGYSGREEVRKSFVLAATRAQNATDAEARGDHAEAKRLWRILLGDDFPTS